MMKSLAALPTLCTFALLAGCSALGQIGFDVTSQGTSTIPGSSLPLDLAGTPFDLTLDDEELAPFVKADSFTITTDAKGTSPMQSTDVEADLTLHISASVL